MTQLTGWMNSSHGQVSVRTACLVALVKSTEDASNTGNISPHGIYHFSLNLWSSPNVTETIIGLGTLGILSSWGSWQMSAQLVCTTSGGRRQGFSYGFWTLPFSVDSTVETSPHLQWHLPPPCHLDLDRDDTRAFSAWGRKYPCLAAIPRDTDAQRTWLFMLTKKKGHIISELCKKPGEAVTPDPRLSSPNSIKHFWPRVRF